MGMLIGNRGRMSKVSKSLAALGSTKKNSVGSSRSPKCKLIECKTFSSSGQDSLSGVFGEGKSAYSQFRNLHHTDIISYLSDDNSNAFVLVQHVTGKTVKSYGWLVDFGHVKTLDYGSTETGVGTASKELVELDQETGVRVSGLDDLAGGLMSGTATTCFQINTHFEVC